MRWDNVMKKWIKKTKQSNATSERKMEKTKKVNIYLTLKRFSSPLTREIVRVDGLRREGRKMF